MPNAKAIPLNPTYIRVGGVGDPYSTWSAAEADTDTDMVTDQKSWIIEIEKGLYINFFEVSASGGIGNTSYHRVLKPKAGHSWQEVNGGRRPLADGSCVFARGTVDTVGSVFYANESYFEIWDMAGDAVKLAEHTSAYWLRVGAIALTIVNNKAIGCYCISYESGYSAGRVYNIGHMSMFVNCIYEVSNQRGFHFAVVGGSAYLYNSYAGDAPQYGVGCLSTVTSFLVKNCINKSTWSGSPMVRTTCLNNTDYADIKFVDAANGDLRLAFDDTEAKEQGTALCTDLDCAFDDDADSHKHSQPEWDIGPFEYHWGAPKRSGIRGRSTEKKILCGCRGYQKSILCRGKIVGKPPFIFVRGTSDSSFLNPVIGPAWTLGAGTRNYSEQVYFSQNGIRMGLDAGPAPKLTFTLPTNVMTVETWTKKIDASATTSFFYRIQRNFGGLIGGEEGDYRRLALLYNGGDTKLQVYADDDGYVAGKVMTSTTISADARHFAVTMVGTVAKLYMNGTLVHTINPFLREILSGSYTIWYPGWNDSASNVGRITMTSLKIYDYEKTDFSDIRQERGGLNDRPIIVN